MTPEPDPGDLVAESTVAYDQFRLDATYYTDDGHEPAPVWASSQYLRELVEGQQAKPADADRQLLAAATQRQLRTLGLYREVVRLFVAPSDPKTGKVISLYVLLFPGEARDNTGIKDLNDNVLGYELNNEYLKARQEEILAIFPPAGGGSGPRYATVGQDYKTAFIIAVGKTGQDFAKDLVRLDARLRVRLLETLKKAERQTKDSKRLTEIRTLRRILEKDENYRFDYLFGANSLPAAGNPLDVVFQLFTEALKAAGVARFAAKGKRLRTDAGKRLGRGSGAEKIPKGQDSRGREFSSDLYLRVSAAADDIKDFMTTPASQKSPLDYYSIYVDSVWTVAFLLYRRQYFGNPDVIRDVRKKALERPPTRAGVKFTFPAQVELLELWLVTLNLIDLIKDFVSAEYPKDVQRYHVQALLALEELEAGSSTVNWQRLTRVLTRDVRQGTEPIAVLGTASEFQFYAYASDYPDQIFFTMDVRDLGVDLMAYYELSTKEILDGDLKGFALMRETFRSSDAIVERKRFTYDSVVAVFGKYHRRLTRSVAKQAADKAFGTAVQTEPALPTFTNSVHVIIGGDEIFVAAHPLYAEHVLDIIRDLAAIQFAGQALNMRTGVVYSSARHAPGAAGAGNVGPGISPAQRKENQIAHDKAMKIAADAPGMLKPLERTQRRIERLIDKLEANDKKKHLVPPHSAKLAALRLMELFARAKFTHAMPLSDPTYAGLRKLLREGNLAGATDTGLFDLVDFSGNEVNARKLATQAAELEAAVRRDVGVDNIHIDPPPVNKIPEWIRRLIDFFFPKPKLTSVGSGTATQA